MRKKSTILISSLFIAMLLLSTSALVFSNVQAQGNATVTVTDVTGGTTDNPGTSTYADGTSFTITATPTGQYAFVDWIVSTDAGSTNYFDNPLTITLTGGTTYTIRPEFQILIAPPGANLPAQNTNAAIRSCLSSSRRNNHTSTRHLRTSRRNKYEVNGNSKQRLAIRTLDNLRCTDNPWRLPSRLHSNRQPLHSWPRLRIHILLSTSIRSSWKPRFIIISVTFIFTYRHDWRIIN